MNECTIPCPDCGTTEGRDYSQFLYWLDSQESIKDLLAWVKVSPCNACEVKRYETQKAQSQGGRPKGKRAES